MIRKIVVAVIVACLIGVGAARTGLAAEGGAALPDTPEGELVAGFLAALNDRDPAALERFVGEHWSANAPRKMTPAERAGNLRRLHEDSGTLSVRAVVAASPEEVTVLLAGETGPPVRLGVRIEAGRPPRILGLRVEVGGPAEENAPPPPPAASTDEAVKAIGAMAAAAAAADEFSGSVLVARRGQPLLRAAYGLANRELGVPNRPETKFNLGSINKVFTKIAVAQLAAAGTVSLDDRLGKWLPDYPNAEAREKVTLRQLLEMSSGIGDFFGERFAATPKDRFRSNRDYLPMFAADPLQFSPGSQRRYSNGGYVVLGEVIARAAASDYYDYVRTHVFARAAMSDSDWYAADAIVPNLAEGYTRRGDEPGRGDGPLVRNIYTRPARGSAAGGGYSTADDLLRFANALLNDTLLPPAWTEWVLGGPEPGAAAAAPAGPHRQGGLGVAGGAPGINAALEVDTGSGLIVVVLANLDPPAAESLASRIRRTLESVPPRN